VVTDKASHWRKRAEELRTLAEGFGSQKAHDDLLAVALQWDRMADMDDRRHANDQEATP
jgi:hypothetical protein